MNKKFLNAVLFGALLASSTGTFTSCKDYDDDIKDLKGQIDSQKSTLEALKTQLSALENASAATQKTAEEAKVAAEAAKQAGDEAKAKAEAAIAAVAKAKQEAIDEAIKAVNALKAEIEAALDKKVNLTTFNEAIAALNGKIEGIETGLSTLGGQVTQNAADIKNALDAITVLNAAKADIDLQLAALDIYTQEMGGDITAIKGDIVSIQETIDGLLEQQATFGEDLASVKADIEGLENRLDGIDTSIREINTNLANLHTLIVARLSSITFAPDYFVSGVEAIVFNSLKYAPMEDNENAEIPNAKYSISTASLATASYHFNPASFNLKNADYGYIDRQATVITRTEASKLVQIEGEPVHNVSTGTIDFKLRRLNVHSTQPGVSKINTIALQATLKGEAIDKDETNVVVTSPYVEAYDAILDANNVRIADKKTLEDGKEAHFATTFTAATKEDPRYTFTYNKDNNLKELIATCVGNNTHNIFKIEDYNLEYRFAVASSKYEITEDQTVTEQQKWFECTDVKAGLFKAKGFNKEAIGRTPILKIELVDVNGNVVRRAFVKVQFGVEKQEDITVGGASYDLELKCNETEASYTIDEDYIRENLYRMITNGKETSMSHEEFWNLYDAAGATTSTKKNNTPISMSIPKIVNGATGVGTATKKIVWDFTHEEIGAVGAGGTQLIATITVKNKLASSEYPASVTFKFTVNVKLPNWNLAKTENDIYWDKDENGYIAYKVNVNIPDSKISPSSACQFNTSLRQAYDKYTVTGLPECGSYSYKIISTFDNGVKTSAIMTGVKIHGQNITLDKANADVKRALNSAKGLQVVVAHIYTYESGDQVTVNEFMTNFIRPVNLNMPSDVAVSDAKTGGDIADFQWNGLLTDWRGEAIIAPSWSLENKTKSYWNQVCTPQYEYIDGHYVMTQEASVDIEYGNVSYTVISEIIPLYRGTATYRFTKRDGTTVEKSFATDMLGSIAEVETSLGAQSLVYQATLLSFKLPEKLGVTDITTSSKSVGEKVEYTYVKNVDYIPAIYEWVDGDFKPIPHIHTGRPAFEGTSYGQMSGCWEWTKFDYPVLNLDLGQYWVYYGTFGEIKADVTKAYTDLEYNDNKLPSNVTLVQSGNTVMYKNVGSPIGYNYNIFIPTTVDYGWGTISTILTIKVNKAN